MTETGEVKPTIMLVGGRENYYVYYYEGLEGYHEKASLESSKNGKPKAVYLNNGYFLLKPEFRIATNIGTTDPQPKSRRMNGNIYRMGVFQAKDIRSGKELILWCYTRPNELTVWENIKNQIDKALFEMQRMGVKPRDDGYMPAVFKLGKAPVSTGLKFVVVVGFTDGKTVTPEEYDRLADKDALELNATTLKNINEYENEEGIRFIRQDDVS